MNHSLDPLLRPRSVAVVGASAREGSPGSWSLTNLKRGGFAGAIYAVNPRYDELQGIRCHASLAHLPEVPDLVIFAIADERIELAVDQAIELGVPAVLLMSALVIDNDTEPPLKTRVQAKLKRAGVLACGANGMGFYNIRDGVWACGFDSRMHEPPGNVSLISHSGSGMCGIVDCEERIRFNFAVSTGNEIGVTMDQYLDFVLDLPETRVVGLFVETARSPEGFRTALEKANRKRIPVIALKVGRTEKAAQLTVSHSGAMAGDDATYDALFDRFGVQRVNDMDELASTLILFSEMHPVGRGALVTLHDSGGERQLLVDLADRAQVPLTELAAGTVEKLEQVLDPELPAVNPLDGWSRGGETASEIMSRSLSIMMQDEDAAIGAVVHDRGPGGALYPSYLRYMQTAKEASRKPVALVAALPGSGCDAQAVEWTHAGFPVLDGVAVFLKGVRALFAYRDHFMQPEMQAPAAPVKAVDRWRPRLAAAATLDEASSLSMLKDFGIPANPCRIVEDSRELKLAATSMTFPVVLKTAAPGVMHKTDRRGVILGIETAEQLLAAYDELSTRLGPRAIVAPMVGQGIEMILGARRDPQFGPVVLLGFGGIHAEVQKDVIFALPPFDDAAALRYTNRLRMRPLLDGKRGAAPYDVEGYCETAARFSAMVYSLGESLQEVDINPVIVTADGCIAVDALIASRQPVQEV
ncbi:MAG TPA: acetate--CoA ligase family protein [Woeseiaceae bacterium]|nr:acetate--CoA ligase family protein [Woeseiaceae bacterium]